MRVIIGIAYHKESDFISDSIYLPIQVGALTKSDWGIQRDCEGDNISFENAYCSELSATYWLWKNVDADYKGLFHYRRFLSFERGTIADAVARYFVYYMSKLLSPFCRDSRFEMPTFSEKSVKESDVRQELAVFSSALISDIENRSMDCYFMKPLRNSTRTINTHMLLSIGTWHSAAFLNIVKADYPEFYPYVEKTLNGGEICAYNILIAKSEIFESYCSLLFGILEKYHAFMNRDIPTGVVNNALLRDSGYVAEIITGAYVTLLKEKKARIDFLNCTFVKTSVSGMSSNRMSLLDRIKSFFA